jgi:hypothetical protein
MIVDTHDSDAFRHGRPAPNRSSLNVCAFGHVVSGEAGAKEGANPGAREWAIETARKSLRFVTNANENAPAYRGEHLMATRLSDLVVRAGRGWSKIVTPQTAVTAV